jgi:UDP-N-acetylmuramoylalanine--D-glutamate ligase
MVSRDKDLAGKKVLVMGLGRFGGGTGVARFLVAQGATVTVTDLADKHQLAEPLASLADLPITYHLGAHIEDDFVKSDIVVVNPAVHSDSLWLKLARKNHVTLTSDMNLLFAWSPAPIVAVTGSNGKSTTTAMIAAVLSKVKKTWVGGNIGGENLLEKISQIQPNDIVVLELSSFQLYALGGKKRSPHIAVVTNMTPNHLDWHGSMKEYVRAKQNILSHQNENDCVVLNAEDAALQDWDKLAKGKVLWYRASDAEGIALKIPGKFNQSNAAAAVAVGQIFNIDRDQISSALQEFQGLPHRLELVREIAGVRYYNDSISTTPESTLAAVGAFEEKKILILGGYDKKIPFDELADKLAGQVEVVVLMGQTQHILAELIETAKQKHSMELPICKKVDDLPPAVSLARQHAQPGSVVLLSPACASYDMFTNFQHRGDSFKQIVNEIPA